MRGRIANGAFGLMAVIVLLGGWVALWFSVGAIVNHAVRAVSGG